MKKFLAVSLTLVAFCLQTFAQTPPKEQADSLINEGALQYKDGKFVEAQKLFEQALALVPEHKFLPLFIARALHQQYKPGVETKENKAKGEQAVAAYKKFLEREPYDENTFNAVAYLYRLMRETEKENEWLMMLADDSKAPGKRRADALLVLASKQWECSYNITEMKENKETRDADARITVRYKKPRKQADFDRARACADEGNTFIERALALNPNSASAWAYKTNLLRELAKLAQMEGNLSRKAELEIDSSKAEAEHKRLLEEENKRAATRDAQPARKIIVPAGLLNDKAISKAAPSYPDEAKMAGASGAVTVQITIDEEGNVIEAKAVSGHPLLRAPSVEAVRRWKFSQTFLSGRPVMVTGTVIVKYALR